MGTARQRHLEIGREDIAAVAATHPEAEFVKNAAAASPLTALPQLAIALLGAGGTVAVAFEHLEAYDGRRLRRLIPSGAPIVKSHTLLLAILFVSMTAMAQEGGGERYTLKRNVDFNSIFPYSTGASTEGDLPFDKPYRELTAAQQRRFKLYYVAMAEGDEPPFPLQGLGAIYRPVSKGQPKLLAAGEFRADAEVDKQGNVVAVAVLESPDEQVTKFMASVLLLTKFKPALCQGQPCAMGFPVRVSFKVE